MFDRLHDIWRLNCHFNHHQYHVSWISHVKRARAETCSVEEKYMTEKLLRCLLKRSENIKTSSLISWSLALSLAWGLDEHFPKSYYTYKSIWWIYLWCKFNDEKFPPNITSDIFPPGVNVAGGNLLMMIKDDDEQWWWWCSHSAIMIMIMIIFISDVVLSSIGRTLISS